MRSVAQSGRFSVPRVRRLQCPAPMAREQWEVEVVGGKWMMSNAKPIWRWKAH
jgi:hypothetical protein